VRKIIVNNTTNLFLKTAIGILLISNHNSFRVLFAKITSVYFIWKNIYIFLHRKWPGQGTSTEPIVGLPAYCRSLSCYCAQTDRQTVYTGTSYVFWALRATVLAPCKVNCYYMYKTTCCSTGSKRPHHCRHLGLPIVPVPYNWGSHRRFVILHSGRADAHELHIPLCCSRLPRSCARRDGALDLPELTLQTAFRWLQPF